MTGAGRHGFRTSRSTGGSFATTADILAPFQTLDRNVIAAKNASVRALAIMLVRQIKITLSQPGSGRAYARGKTKKLGRQRYHIASAPGEAPAVDTGGLRGSIDFEREPLVGVRRSLFDAAFRVGTAHEAAEILEHGDLGDGGRLAPRPFMRPALAAVERQWGHEIRTRLQQAVRGGGGLGV